jgi:histidine ammonia-lyase
MDDNPLVVPDEDRMVSNGNFHPILMTLAVDALRPALAHVGQLADRRAGHLWDALVADPALLSPEGIVRLGPAPLLRYSVAARTAELRQLAQPASLDVGPLDLGVEDHATNAPAVVRRTDEALTVLEDVLAGELVIAAASVAWSDANPERMAPRTRTILDALGAKTGDGADGRPAAADAHARAREVLLGLAAMPTGA